MEYFPDFPGNLLVGVEPGPDKDHFRPELQGFFGGHGRAYTEPPGFITGSSYYPPTPFRRTANYDGPVPVFRVIPLLHGCIKCVHVNMDDFSLQGSFRMLRVHTVRPVLPNPIWAWAHPVLRRVALYSSS